MDREVLVNKEEVTAARTRLLGQRLRNFFTNFGFNLQTLLVLIIVFVLLLAVLVVGLFLVKPNQKVTNSAKTTASGQQVPNAFNSKISTSVLAGNVIEIDLNKNTLTAVGQVDTSLQTVKVSFAKNTDFEKVIYDPKTQAKISSEKMQAADIKVNDVVQIYSSKKIGETLSSESIVRIEILKPQQ